MNFRSNTILVYLPKNQDDEVILNQALFFKQALGMRIFVLHILQIVPLLPQKLRIKWAQKIKKSGLIELTRIVKNTLQKEIPEDIFLRVKFGNVVQTLIKESRKGGYEFIIIDKSNGNLKWALKRSQVNKIINRSYCPVLVLNKEFPLITMNKIIIPFDISQPTRKRLLWATRLAKKFNAKIQIVSALTVNIDEKKSRAYSNAEKIKQMLEERGVECEVKVIKALNQETHKVILNYIEEEQPGMVIIRTHQEMIFPLAHIGKFVSEIVQHCKAPVFVVGYSEHNMSDD